MTTRAQFLRRLGSATPFALLVSTGCPTPGPQPEREWMITDEPDESVGALLAVWGAGPDKVRAVGGQIDAVGDAGVGVVLARDGERWSSETIPDSPLINWIHGAGGVTWAVGNEGAALLEQGGTWSRVDTPVDVPLWGVFAISADEAWAVGGDAFDTATNGVLVRYVGGAWTEVELPDLDRPASAIFKVWASSATDVHAVGDNGVILHYDGGDWTQVPTAITDDLISLWGTGPAEIVAVGGRSNGVLVRYDGSSWQGSQLAAVPALNGVWMNADGEAIVVGERGTISTLAAGSMEPEFADTPASVLVLHAAFGFDDGERFSVGGSLGNSPPYTGIILEER